MTNAHLLDKAVRAARERLRSDGHDFYAHANCRLPGCVGCAIDKMFVAREWRKLVGGVSGTKKGRPSIKTRLLAALADGPKSREDLLRIIYGDNPPRKPDEALRVFICGLRREGAPIETHTVYKLGQHQ